MQTQFNVENTSLITRLHMNKIENILCGWAVTYLPDGTIEIESVEPL